MALTEEEKGMIQESLALYLQACSQQIPPAQVQQLAQIAQGIIKKLDAIGSGNGKKGNKPNGITDKWYKDVCLSCDKLSSAGCTDKVTVKFPGKCDPILHYEQGKRLEKR